MVTGTDILREVLCESPAHAARNGHAAFVQTVAAVARAANLCIEADRVCNLNLGARVCVGGNQLIVVAVGTVFRRINAHIALAAV